jgi:hypothetical protein
MLNPIKKKPKSISKIEEAILSLNNPPNTTKMIEGMPMLIRSFLSMPSLNNTILLTLLDKWNRAVMPNTE